VDDIGLGGWLRRTAGMGKRGSTPERAPVESRDRASWHWLIVRNTTSELEILTLDVGSHPRMLPVFGSEEAALRMLPSFGGWRVRKTCSGELISVLCGPCRDAPRVALDPSPEILAAGMVELVTENKDGFLDTLLGRGRAWFHNSLTVHRPSGLYRRGLEPDASRLRRAQRQNSSVPQMREQGEEA
jgi:hypothetical protein